MDNRKERTEYEKNYRFGAFAIWMKFEAAVCHGFKFGPSVPYHPTYERVIKFQYSTLEKEVKFSTKI